MGVRIVDFEKLLAERNRSNPFAQYVGVVITKIEEGYAEASLEIREEHLNPVGYVHGGVLYTMADVAAGAATVSLGSHAVTVSGEYHYLAPAKGTKEVTTVAKCIKKGKTILVFDLEVYTAEKKLVGKGTFTTYRLADQPIILD